MKKTLFMPLLFFVAIQLVSATTIDIEFPNTDSFEPGEPITFKATIYSDEGLPLDGRIDVTLQDSERKITRTVVQSKEVASIEVSNFASGQGVITAENEGTKGVAFFEIGRSEGVTFELSGDYLIVTNTGNTPYSRTISITIGDTIGTQTPNLEIGESTRYRLIAPDGTYFIKVEDGIPSHSKTWGSIRLTGTGNVIGAIDDSNSGRATITGGISPDEGNIAILSYIQQNKFVYVFVAVIFGAMILVAIERRYKNKLSSNKK